ncbi:MAG: CBS domain-containing protein [Planctomycetota bacterium]|nr:MAG: CBS domain-containing protein [Planctomycetota bacterium]
MRTATPPSIASPPLARPGPALVDSLMTRDCLSCRAEDKLDHAAQLMWEGDCGFLPVVSADGVVTGVITDRDICMSAYTRGRGLKEIAVMDAMARVVRAVKPTDTLATAEGVMRASRVRRVPVVDDAGRLAGILSMNDLARAAAREERLSHPRLTVAEVTETLAAICEPRGGVLMAPAASAPMPALAGAP